jgi:heat shock protein HslJ
MRVTMLPATLALAACAGASAGGGGAGRWTELEPESGNNGEVIEVAGTVHRLDIEGGVFVIENAEGTRFNPTNLPEAFKVEGKAVEAEARQREDVMSLGMVGPIVELLRIRERAGSASEAAAPALAGTRWRLEDLAGAGVIDDAQATLEFVDGGRAAGNTSCNRFTGTVTVSGSAIAFGALAATRRACAEAVMSQESRYLAALGQARRFEVSGSTLLIHPADGGPPLRFVAE